MVHGAPVAAHAGASVPVVPVNRRNGEGKNMTTPAAVATRSGYQHEHVAVRRGERSGLPIVVAVHSTALGPALGGCRLRHYPDWREGLADALRLSTGMTYKCAAAGLPHGGGKAVIVAPARPLSAAERRAALLDLADAVDALDGRYLTGPDVGTRPADMVTVGERTRHVCCLPTRYGGSGDSAPATARGVGAAIRAVCAYRFGSPAMTGRSVTVIGLGAVGARVARSLAAAGARLTISDIDPARRRLARTIGADWLEPANALTAPADVLVPAAVGGILTADAVSTLRCAAVAGPANNQLAEESLAEDLHDQGIIWVPDFVASAGGVIYASAVEQRGLSRRQALADVDRIGTTVTALLAAAGSPHAAAVRLVRERLPGG